MNVKISYEMKDDLEQEFEIPETIHEALLALTLLARVVANSFGEDFFDMVTFIANAPVNKGG